MRFFLASLAAFSLDLALALILRETMGLSVAVSAAISFITVAGATYFVHEHWTFRRDGSRNSAGRLTRNLAANGVAFSIRVGLIAIIEAIHQPESTLLAAAYIATGAAASLTVNYLLNRFWVFSGK